MKKRAYRALTAVLALVLLVSGGYIAYKTLDYQKGAEDYDNAAKAAGLPRRLTPPEEFAPEEELEQVRYDPYAALLNATDLDALREINGDVIGWITIPETDLSYPLLQGGDNRYYLNHTWSGERNSAGAIFLECQCAPDFSDFNTIVYGHRMNNTLMFGSLRGYQEEGYWKEHPSVYIVDDENVYRYDIFAAFQARVEDAPYQLKLRREEDKEAFLQFSLERSVFQTDVEPTAEGRVLTLSTCVSGTGRSPTRWVVQAALAYTFDRDKIIYEPADG